MKRDKTNDLVHTIEIRELNYVRYSVIVFSKSAQILHVLDPESGRPSICHFDTILLSTIAMTVLFKDMPAGASPDSFEHLASHFLQQRSIASGKLVMRHRIRSSPYFLHRANTSLINRIWHGFVFLIQFALVIFARPPRSNFLLVGVFTLNNCLAVHFLERIVLYNQDDTINNNLDTNLKERPQRINTQLLFT